MRRFCVLLSSLAVAICSSAQTAGPADSGMAAGPWLQRAGATKPEVLRSVEPNYTPDAISARVQGTVVIELVVDAHGVPANLRVVSPLGCGLDESALAAVRQWRFKPAELNGRPVNSYALIEVNFLLTRVRRDANAEERRTRINVALRNLDHGTDIQKAAGRKAIEEMAENKYPPAMHALGRLLYYGRAGQAESERGAALILAAAEKKYAPALYQAGLMHIQGIGASPDSERGLKMMREAADRGSVDAQAYLGGTYLAGRGVEPDRERARRYYRLCAAAGQERCQLELGRLLLEGAGVRREREYLEAIAWLQLASDRGLTGATELLAPQIAALTAEQSAWVASLRAKLVRKQ